MFEYKLQSVSTTKQLLNQIYTSNFSRVDLTSMKRFPFFSIRKTSDLSIRKVSDLDFLKINESYFAIVMIDFYFIGYYVTIPTHIMFTFKLWKMLCIQINFNPLISY